MWEKKKLATQEKKGYEAATLTLSLELTPIEQRTLHFPH